MYYILQGMYFIGSEADRACYTNPPHISKLFQTNDQRKHRDERFQFNRKTNTNVNQPLRWMR